MSRFRDILNLEQYERDTRPLQAGPVNVSAPLHQMILRMLVKAPYSGGLRLPPELEWLREVLVQAQRFQRLVIGVKHPFTYITVRSGAVVSLTDDLWHVDGFSMRYTHIPEANYVFTLGENPTQYLDQTFGFPADFNPLRHNINTFLQARVNEDLVLAMYPATLYLIDPYVVHRRPPGTSGVRRTFVRISFTPIEIPDVNNTPNPLIPTPHYVTDGVKDFRDTLVNYPE